MTKQAPEREPIDIDRIYRALIRHQPPTTPPPPLREVPSIDPTPATGTSRPVTGGQLLEEPVWVDGIQSTWTPRRHQYRPLTLCHVAAGATSSAGDRGPAYRDSLWLACSEVDQPWLRDLLQPELEVVAVEDGPPDQISHRIREMVAARRRAVELQAVQDAVTNHSGAVVVDGPLAGHGTDPRMVAVVKSHPVARLVPERFLHQLGVGCQTEVFPVPDTADGPVRWATYLRLHQLDPRRHTPLHGLLRLEANAPHQLDRLARTAMGARQNSRSGDARWDRHLQPMAWCEFALRAQRPTIFGLDLPSY